MANALLDDSIINMALGEIDFFLQGHGKRLTHFSDMPQLNLSTPSYLRSLLIEEELSYDREELQKQVQIAEQMMNDGQLDIWRTITDALDAQRQGISVEVRTQLTTILIYIVEY